MKLTKKNIGQLFDVRGADGSWAYQLLDIRKGELLFYVFGSAPARYEIDSQKVNDWFPFKPRKRESTWDIGAWDQGRRAK